jgi:Arc/MetJ-type ribon-helix-helix transcriptional regulator
MKVSGTIDNDLCAWMRKKIEERSFYNQSHAIELGLKKLRDEDGGNTIDGKGRR